MLKDECKDELCSRCCLLSYVHAAGLKAERAKSLREARSDAAPFPPRSSRPPQNSPNFFWARFMATTSFTPNVCVFPHSEYVWDDESDESGGGWLTWYG